MINSTPEIIVRNRDGELVSFPHIERIIEATTIDQVAPILNEVDACKYQGLHAVGFVTYDAAPAFDEAYRVKKRVTQVGESELHNFPLAWFALCRNPVPVLDCKFLPPFALPDWMFSESQQNYLQKIDSIRRSIAEGTTYQVNYTIRCNAPIIDDSSPDNRSLYPWHFFLRTAESAPYASYLDIGRFVISSASPELFFERIGEKLIMKPMKGTAPRRLDSVGDEQSGNELRASIKNRAENLMIVDMIRSDVGSIAKTGSVVVEKLFELERYPSLWQMTSTVTAMTDAPLSEVFSALFPCASITGAPKVETMRIIEDIEDSPRGLYTGAIGVVYPDGDAKFSVAIRTALFDRQKQSVEYGVGSGIVWDSDAEDEYRECLLKTQVVTKPTLEKFSLLETIRYDQDIVVSSDPITGLWLIDEHLDRLESSAAYFNYPFDRHRILSILRREVANLVGIQRIRLLLDIVGSVQVEPVVINRGDIGSFATVTIAKKPVDESNLFLYHKTTNRILYQQYIEEYPQYDDVILFNRKGEVTEGCLHNLIVRLDGVDYTPPVSSGLLAGTLRAKLLSEGSLVERVLYLDDLIRADSIRLINSVRGIREATLV